MSHLWVSLGPAFYLTALPCSAGYHLERGRMPLHDAAGMNRKRGRNYWKSRLRCQVYAKGYMLMIVCVLSDLTWLPLLGRGRKSWFIIINKLALSCISGYWQASMKYHEQLSLLQLSVNVFIYRKMHSWNLRIENLFPLFDFFIHIK